MAKDLRFQASPLAEEFDVGDDSDMPGFDQPYTRDDVDAVLNSASTSVDERRSLLLRMIDDLQARQGMDEANEYADLIEEIRGALATLSETDENVETAGAFAFDPADHALAPDEIMERAEEEAALDRAEG
jgi:predicted Ser/Thr protein kinase